MRLAVWVLLITALSADATATVITVLLTGDIGDVGILAWAVAAPILGAILVLRVGAVRMGFLMLAIGLGGSVAAVGASVPNHPSYVDWLPLLVLSSVGWLAFLGLTLAGLPLLFPTGEPPSPRWRPIFSALIGVLALGSVLSTLGGETTTYCSDVFPDQASCATWERSGEPLAIEECDRVQGPEGPGTECLVRLDNPIGVDWIPPLEGSLVGDIGYGALLLIAILAIVSMGVRVRHAGRQERQQVKFLFASLGLLIGWSLLQALTVEVLQAPLPAQPLIDFALWAAIPLTIFLAIVRYRLYDIDRLISRTVSYTIVVGTLAGVVALAATLIGTRFSDPLVVAATTLGVAAVFNPLRRRVQRLVDRRFNRSRYDAERVMSDFTSSLRDRVDIDEVVEDCRSIVTNTMQPVSVSVWIRE